MPVQPYAGEPAETPDQGAPAGDRPDHAEPDTEVGQRVLAEKARMRGVLAAGRRERVPARDRVADGRAIAEAALALCREIGVRPGDWVAAFESLPSEPATKTLVEALSRAGFRVLLPVTLPDWDLDWREAGSPELLGAGAVSSARVVFLPAHAVDAVGTRLGRGKGCYDRALPRTHAFLVALVHPWEVLEEPLPAEPHDRRVDAVITADTGLRRLHG
ncbi:5-formyltetrahydrofolate cyclo-ligase [Pedococcus sp. 5OH_020]|uniref:5-formyltetrahydrofolate cyclo-ligase n=1 Tax=Pedococcus sp. 5OH_020 TaxID=2989814 RepID=UPI0022E9F513|nr:5-formyltetrahydrofolate cyclo-ligase [Pedococcus sp. 5OH_020]